MSIGQIGLSSLTLFLLAALVGPAAFGTIALALVLIMFLQLLLQQGMGAAIVQRDDLQREHLDAAFWMVMGLSVAARRRRRRHRAVVGDESTTSPSSATSCGPCCRFCPSAD